MEILRDTNIDFMKYRKYWVVVSLLFVGAGVFFVFFHGKLNVGIDFAGGTQLILKFKDRPQVQVLRDLVAKQGLADAQIQRYDEVEKNSVLIRTRLVSGLEEGSTDKVVAALDARYNAGQTKPDLNRIGAPAVAQLLFAADPDRVKAQGDDAASAHYQAVATALLAQRKEDGIFTSFEKLAAEGVSRSALSTLEKQTVLGSFAVEGVETVGPQIGSELRRRGYMAVMWSLIGMLIYIWIRFELRFGVGAIMACVHDVLVTLGLFALAGFEFNLTTIAAFLTLVGYSVNDTVVIFDRIRENMRKNRREPLIVTMNKSINQTLARTILTGGSTLLALAALLVWGGDVIRGFAFVMTVGILVGTYSSIYIASPFALLWEQLFGDRRRSAAEKGGAGPGKPAAVKAR